MANVSVSNPSNETKIKKFLPPTAQKILREGSTGRQGA